MSNLRRSMMMAGRRGVDWEAIVYQMITGKSTQPYIDIVIPEGVTEIRPYAFRRCYCNSITFPSTLTTIGQQALEYLYGTTKTIELGANVTTIGSWALQGMKCNKLIIHATTPPKGAGTPSGSYPIYVPDDSVDAYKAAAQWSDFASRIFPISDMP